jgi:hypothetical protein
VIPKPEPVLNPQHFMFQAITRDCLGGTLRRLDTKNFKFALRKLKIQKSCSPLKPQNIAKCCNEN